MCVVRALFTEYARSLNVALCFQNFEEELAALPGDYCALRGALIVDYVNGEPAGCCALRPLDAANYTNACELKRLFVYAELGFKEIPQDCYHLIPGSHYLIAML